MALNTRVASVLQQAACRRRDIKRCRFVPNPDCTDHTERKIDWTVEFKGKREEEEGQIVIENDDEFLAKGVVELLDFLIGKEENPTLDTDERKFYLSKTINQLLEA